MESLHEYFKEFIAEQIAADPLWCRVDVVYSGHDVSCRHVFCPFDVGSDFCTLQHFRASSDLTIGTFERECFAHQILVELSLSN